MLFTSDKIIYTAKQNDQYGLFINGKIIDYYKGISNLVLSNDKETLLYAYDSETGVYIKSGNESIGPFEEIKYFLISDDKLVSYAVKEKSQFYIYTENKKYGPFDEVSDWAFQSTACAYKVHKNNKQYIYTEKGLLAGPFDNIYLKCFSDDGKLLAYETREDNKSKKSIQENCSTLWINKKKIEDGWRFSNINFTNDNNIIYTIYNKNDKNYIHCGKKKYGSFIQIREVTTSNDKKLQAFSYSYDYAPNEKYYLCVLNEKAGPYDDCYNIKFSPDGNSLAYVVKENNNEYLIYNQKKIGPYESITDINISENKKLAYISSDEFLQNFILHIENFESARYDFITDLKFYKDTITYTAEKNDIYYDMIIYKEKELVGSFINGNLVYIEDGKIQKIKIE